MSFSTKNSHNNSMQHLIYLLFFILVLPYTSLAQGGGSWQFLLKNVGISAMHMQLLSNDNVVMFDRTNFGASNISLPPGKCRKNPKDEYLKVDCTAHSVEYNPSSNSVRPLNIFSDTWCSSGAVLGDGRLAQTGGYNDGERVVRTFQPSECPNCDWHEINDGIIENRWYATNHILPDGRSIIFGGRAQFNYEFYPKTPSTSKVIPFPFLAETNDRNAENNLYPFVFLNVDGNIFLFANNRAVLFDYNKNVIVRRYPTIPGGEPRNYPSMGSAVLLPLKNTELGAKAQAEVLICGGARPGAYQRALRGQLLPVLNTCARISITDPNADWVIETMPMTRFMSDMVMLPNGDVLVINGAATGIASWELGRDPVLKPLIYHPDNDIGSRFEVMTPTTIPRMYHSCAILLRDGRVLVGGSNPHQFYNFTNVLFPTELSLEAYLPPYLDPSQSKIRPVIVYPNSSTKIKYRKILKIKFNIKGIVKPDPIKVTMIRPPFTTHSNSQGQRHIVLTNTTTVKPSSRGRFQIKVRTPVSAVIAPPGPYMVFVVHQNVPSVGIWVHIA